MDLRLLQIFCVIFEHRSVSLAARQLRLSQPTVSEHLRTLERQVGVPLFDRLSRQLQPTRAGEHLYSQARPLAELERSITTSLGQFLNRLTGPLPLGASTVPGEYLLPPVLGPYRKRHPGVVTSLRIKDSRAVLEDVAAGRVDAGFVGSRPAPGALRFTPFASDHLVVTLPVGPPWDAIESLSLAELQTLPLIVRPEGSGTRGSLETFLESHGLHLSEFQVVAELDSATAIKEAIRADVGCSVLSHLSLRTASAAGSLREVPWRGLPAPRREFFAVTDSRRSPSPLVEELLALLLASPPPDPAA